jgi:protein-glutamine gamma-glutamyltransferase
MSLERFFRISSSLLLWAGSVTLFAAGGIGAPKLLVYGAAIAATFFLDINAWTRLQVVAISALTLWFGVEVFFFSNFTTAAVHFLLLVSLLKLVTIRNDRDYQLLYLISFTFVLLASTFALSVLYPIAFIIYVFLAVLTLILFETRTCYENRGAALSIRPYLTLATAITVLVVLVAVPVFLIIPRGGPDYSGGNRLPQPLTGFSDHVSLGDIGRILPSHRVVMRVKLDKPFESLPADLKWRGIALDHFNGNGWTRTRLGDRLVYRDQEATGFLVAQDRRAHEFLLAQTFWLEPFTPVVFGLPEIIQISTNASTEEFVLQAGTGSYSIYPVRSGPRRYTVFSDFMTRDERLARPTGASIRQRPHPRYLQLPWPAPDIRELAESVTAEKPDALAKAAAIERFLKSRYSYTLKNPSGGRADPVRHFLFESKAGHCEYFATAQALMMRSVGIPTRLVNGFRAGEYSRWSNEFVVRQSDAHSWVEGYIPGIGWIDFDATPPDFGTSFRVARLGGQLLDALESFWNGVLTFDRTRQVGVFYQLGQKLRSGWDHLSSLNLQAVVLWVHDGLNQRPERIWAPVLVLLAAFGGYLFRRRFFFYWSRGAAQVNGSETAPQYYLEMLELLSRKGFQRRPAETPAEFESRIRATVGSPFPSKITEVYYRSRFGGAALTDQELAQVHSWLKQLRRANSRIIPSLWPK